MKIFGKYKSIELAGDFEILIGSNKNCTICLTEQEVPQIAKKQAILKRIKDRLFIQDLGSKSGIFIENKRLPNNNWKEIVRQNFKAIKFGDTTIEIDEQLFRGRPRIGVETTSLYHEISGKIVCDGIFIKAKPGTMTAIMGPTGCGKSILLDLLNGYRTPDTGEVFVTKDNFKINIHHDYNLVREWLGYLPQDDVMIPELTVYQSLNYCLKLQFTRLNQQIRQYIIHQTCQNLGFKLARLDKFLHTVIGSAESGIRGLSGGERKRANLAHELIAMPLVLLLDEPTSGLSSVDADKIVRLLQKLTQLDDLTTIATIHQPSQDTFERFDNLLLMNYGGTVAYYGPISQAVSHFESTTGIINTNRNPAEYLLEILDRFTDGMEFPK
ncbi:MAG: ATP-binding cassette domain-containing protein [Candidatus Marithrix sp.]|nr:ATP-binding cassette domain-containing protein [Candidatus Marithrix sp.]